MNNVAALSNKIDFAVVFTVTNANPNGDPLNGNRPRETSDGRGEVSDVAIKRKIRNRLQDNGENIFVQSEERRKDNSTSLQDRASKNDELKAISKEMSGKNIGKNFLNLREAYEKIACREWIDVRSFGQVFALKKSKESEESAGKSAGGISIGVRGPVSINKAISVSPIDIIDMQIVKSVNGNDKEDNGGGKSSDTMGTKHMVEFGLYICKGSINCQLAEKTGFTDEDAEKIKDALTTLFENDCSSARPDGSMEVCTVYWWKHSCKYPKISTAKVHRSLTAKLKDGVTNPQSFDDYIVTVSELEGVDCEVIQLR